MHHPGFFHRAGPFSLARIAEATGAEIAEGGDPEMMLGDVRPLSDARADDITFLDNPKYSDQLSKTQASACLLKAGQLDNLPAGTTGLLSKAPYRGFALALQLFYPDAMRPAGLGFEPGLEVQSERSTSGALVHPDAEIESGAHIEPGAIIGKEARIGRGTVVSSGAVIGYRVHIGRDGYVGPGASIIHALIGDRVILHAGVRIGQDGFGFAMGADGHLKVPQIGRVIIQDDVEMGANSCADRGALSDTIIGQGTKIDDLVMIAHNVEIGRHCVIVSQCGIAGSSKLGDFVIMGGQAGVAGHVTLGNGVQIAGTSHVKDSFADGMRLGGTPAKPFREWARELAFIKKSAAKDKSAK